MKEKIVESNRDYVRVDNSYIVNRNEAEYYAALARRRNLLQQKNFENRLNSLEEKMNIIIELLNRRN